MPLNRRHLLRASATFGAAALLPSSLAAQARTLVAATFPGTWNEAQREILSCSAPIRFPVWRPPKADDRRLMSRCSTRRRCSTPPSRD